MTASRRRSARRYRRNSYGVVLDRFDKANTCDNPKLELLKDCVSTRSRAFGWRHVGLCKDRRCSFAELGTHDHSCCKSQGPGRYDIETSDVQLGVLHGACKRARATSDAACVTFVVPPTPVSSRCPRTALCAENRSCAQLNGAHHCVDEPWRKSSKRVLNMRPHCNTTGGRGV
jgi:hypothetical protein